MKAPLLDRSDFAEPSAFRPEALLREARRQKAIVEHPVPVVLVLDPDGDLVDHVRAARGATLSPHWACYHTKLWQWRAGGLNYGIVGHAVGASFAVLVAEQAFACGCELLVSVTSAGQLRELGPPPYHVVIDRALRDEGTSYHYLPASDFSEADPALLAVAAAAFARIGLATHRGGAWTTDAPFRETETAIAARVAQGLAAVEMEAAALYAFARARRRPVLCLAQVTNQMGRIEGDFEKGEANGAAASLRLVEAMAVQWFGVERQDVETGSHRDGRARIPPAQRESDAPASPPTSGG